MMMMMIMVKMENMMMFVQVLSAGDGWDDADVDWDAVDM